MNPANPEPGIYVILGKVTYSSVSFENPMFIITMVDGNPVFHLLGKQAISSLWRYDSDSNQLVTYNVTGYGTSWIKAVQASVGLGSIASDSAIMVDPLRKSQVNFKAYVL